MWTARLLRDSIQSTIKKNNNSAAKSPQWHRTDPQRFQYNVTPQVKARVKKKIHLKIQQGRERKRLAHQSLLGGWSGKVSIGTLQRDLNAVRE